MIYRLNYYPLVVPATFLMALLISQLAHWLLIPLDSAIDRLAAQCKHALAKEALPR